jgi:hypothetical protein
MSNPSDKRRQGKVIRNTRLLADLVGQDPVELAKRLDAARKATPPVSPQTPPPASDDH